MVIYVWPNGNWCYEWEMKGFTMEHLTIPTGGRWIDLDKLLTYSLTREEQLAINEALGG